MRIAVVIPAFNAGTCLQRSLDSVQVQTLPPVEVIVVDDGSTDDTPEIARAHPLRPRLIQIRNSGVATARNIGMETATADYIALLDADDEFMPGHLAALSAAANQHPEAVLLWAGTTRQFAAGAEKEAGTLPDFNAIARAHSEPGEGARVVAGAAYDQLLQGNFIATSSSMFKRSIAGTVLSFNSKLKLGEDRLFFLELMVRGAAVFVDRETVIIHRDGTNASVTIDPAKRPILVERRIAVLLCVEQLPAVQSHPHRLALVRKLLGQAYRDQVYYASFLGVRKTFAALHKGWAARQIRLAIDALFVLKNLARAASNSSVVRRVLRRT